MKAPTREERQAARREKQAHRALLRAIGILVSLDPAASSNAGKLLVKIAAAVEEYEKKLFP